MAQIPPKKRVYWWRPFLSLILKIKYF
jgi:hypothetical protein